MSNVLSRIDAAIDNLCPCGAPPRDGSIYCSYDCEPTHISRDTDIRETGELATPMRWRPDLVTHADDANLRPLECQRSGYTGHHNATVFERTDRPDMWHLRLDDGHRYVGLDVEVNVADGIIDTESAARIMATWAKLERELTNTAHLDPEPDPWADALRTVDAAIRASQGLATDAAPSMAGFVWRRHCPHCGNHTVPVDGRRPVTAPAWFDPSADLNGNALSVPCHLCRNCRTPLPGPRMALTTRLRRTPSGSTYIEVTLTSSSRAVAGSLPSDVSHQEIQSCLDAMERELVCNPAAERACQSGFTPDLRNLFRITRIV